MQERSKGMETQIFDGGNAPSSEGAISGSIRRRMRAGRHQRRAQSGTGLKLTGVTVFRVRSVGPVQGANEAQEARLEQGRWVFKNVRRYGLDNPLAEEETYVLPTTLTAAQVRGSFSTPETVPFWQLPDYIRSSEKSGQATAGYRLQYHKLLARPFLLAAMVLLAAAVSLRFFRFGGVQKMVLSGVAAGFLLYVLSKVTEDLSKAELMHPLAAAWLPVCVGGLSGFWLCSIRRTGSENYRRPPRTDAYGHAVHSFAPRMLRLARDSAASYNPAFRSGLLAYQRAGEAGLQSASSQTAETCQGRRTGRCSFRRRR